MEAPTAILHSKFGKVGEITPISEDNVILFWVDFPGTPFFDIHVDFDMATEAAQTIVRDFLNDPEWEDCVR